MSKQTNTKRHIKFSDWVSDKLNLSLTLKLNFKSTADLFRTFFKFNIVFLTAAIVFFIYSADQSVIKVKDKIIDENQNNIVFFNDDVQIYNAENVLVEKRFNYYLPMNQVLKHISENKNISDRTLRWKTGSYIFNLRDIEYIVDIQTETGQYKIGYNLHSTYRNTIFFSLGVVVIELFFVLGQLFRNRKSIEQSLSPISELTEIVKEINGSDLDKRISIVGTQNEFVDLTQEINAMLDRIQGSYEAQSRFVSDASHELRTPIAVIQGYANLIDRWGKEDPETLTESISAIKSETESMKKLVEQLLFLARGDKENLSANKTSIELSAIVEEILNESKVIDKEHQYSLNRLEMIWIDGDINLIKQVVRIFIDNAKKYTPKNRTITLDVFEQNGQGIISIQDEGIGMNDHEIANMFERFFRADKARSRKDGGSGLGLSIADQILRLHNADINVISMKNIGTKITLKFPIVEQKEIFNIA